MKRTAQAAVIVLLILTAGVAAADTAEVAVSARVRGTCRFQSAGTLAFGDLPFDATGNAVGKSQLGSLTFWCTNGASYTITDDDGRWKSGPGNRQMKSDNLAAPEYIAYSLSYSPATGTGNGPSNPITLTLDGTVGATYTANSPDTYSDTVTLTISP